MRYALLILIMTLSATASASYTCDQLTVEQLCTLRDGYDMATCARGYCGGPEYNCDTCPGLLDAGVDLNIPATTTSQDGGCSMAGAPSHTFSFVPLVLAAIVLLRSRRRSTT